MSSIDLIESVSQLSHILSSASIQGLLHDRLLGAGWAPKGLLQAQVGSQAGIDFHQPMSASQQADKGIHQLVDGRMLDGFLPDLHPLADRTKEIQLAQFHSYGRQRSCRAKMVRRRCERLVHGDAPSHASDYGFFHEIKSITFLCFSQARLFSDTLVANLGET